jgi:hypothetical protein
MKKKIPMRLIIYGFLILSTLAIIRLYHNMANEDRMSTDTFLEIYNHAYRNVTKKPVLEQYFKLGYKLKETMKLPMAIHNFLLNHPVFIILPSNKSAAEEYVQKWRQPISDILSLCKDGAIFQRLTKQQLDDWKNSREWFIPSYFPADSTKISLMRMAPEIPAWASIEIIPVIQAADALLIQAELDIYEGRLDEAMQCYRDILTIGDAFRYYYTNFGSYITFTLRNKIERALSKNFWTTDSAALDRACLDFLNEVCQNHILPDEKSCLYPIMNLIWLQEEQRNIILLCLYAERLIDITPENCYEFSWCHEQRYYDNLALGYFGWTFFPFIHKTMKNIGTKNTYKNRTFLLNQTPLTQYANERLTPLMRSIIMGYRIQSGITYSEILHSTEAAIRLELLRAGFAIRLYKRDKGRLPDSYDDLIPEYIPSRTSLKGNQEMFIYRNIYNDLDAMLYPIRIKKLDFDSMVQFREFGFSLSGEYDKGHLNDTTSSMKDRTLRWKKIPEAEIPGVIEYLKKFKGFFEEIKAEPCDKAGTKNISARFRDPYKSLAVYAPGANRRDDGGVSDSIPGFTHADIVLFIGDVQ